MIFDIGVNAPYLYYDFHNSYYKELFLGLLRFP